MLPYASFYSGRILSNILALSDRSSRAQVRVCLVGGLGTVKDARASDAGGTLQASLDAGSPAACQQLCAGQGVSCAAFTFKSASKKCELRKAAVSSTGVAQEHYTVRTEVGSICGPRVCPDTTPSGDVVEP